MVRLETPSDLEIGALQQALNVVVEHHDTLRLQFTHNGIEWQQSFGETVKPVEVECVDLQPLSEAERQSVVDEQVVELHRSLDLAKGKLLGAAFVEQSEQVPGQLYLVVHHLAIDGVSWYPLLEDLETAYNQIRNHESIKLPKKTTSYRQWAEVLHDYAQTDELQNELSYWLKQGQIQIPLPVDLHHESANLTRASVATICVRLDADATQNLLQDVHSAYNTQINDLLLTALARTMTDWMGGRSMLIDVEGHGREDIGNDLDLSRTVGWFTSIAPIGLELPVENELGKEIKVVKEKVRGMPNRGIGYGILRYLSPEPELQRQLAAQPRANVLFKYLGQLDQMAARSKQFRFFQKLTPSCGLQNYQEHPLEVNVYVRGGELHAEFTYNTKLHREQTIFALANRFLDELQNVIDHCLDPTAGGYTPSDFSLAGLDQAGLDQLASVLEG